jgi:hypothetical protein
MRPLEHLTNEDLLLLIKEESKRLNKAVQNKVPAEQLVRINNMIIEIATEMITRMPAESKPLNLDK